jgi:TolA-binding protein
MTRFLPGWTSLFLLLLLAPAARAQDPAPSSAPASVQAELRLERRLLSLDLVSYNEIRERERRAREQVSAVLGRLDQALASDAMSLGSLETLRDQLAAAHEAAHTAEMRLNSQLENLQERMRRIAVLEGDNGTARPADALTGRWRVTVLPQNFTATFNLRLNGTVVSGTYAIDGGGTGSFRGTLASGHLRLERIDAQGGADSLWEGTLGTNRIDDGTWGTNELVTGQPTRGKWTAVRESGS